MLTGKDSEAVWGGLSLKKFSDWLATGLGAGPGGSSGAVLSHPRHAWFLRTQWETCCPSNYMLVPQGFCDYVGSYY